jgi:hypothetical protein
MVLFSALILSGYSSTCFASYFFFLKNNNQQVGEGVNLSGTLAVPENALGTHPALTFDIPATLQTSQVWLEKAGTKGNLECINMGTNTVGLTETIQSISPTADYTLTLTVDASATSGGCVSGNPAPVRVASITGPDNFSWNGNYHLYNNAASIPEPGSLALLGMGLSALVFVKRRRTGRS